MDPLESQGARIACLFCGHTKKNQIKSPPQSRQLLGLHFRTSGLIIHLWKPFLAALWNWLSFVDFTSRSPASPSLFYSQHKTDKSLVNFLRKRLKKEKRPDPAPNWSEWEFNWSGSSLICIDFLSRRLASFALSPAPHCSKGEGEIINLWGLFFSVYSVYFPRWSSWS